ncbi:hypothetical protein ACFP81_10610 [Deinococcus lacus]|uniref:Uncharacterized protein n=1 Tax=Deinococcus lacus TaxID=392561 RepID=A0ABW1YHR1_9DEIO
MTAQLEFNNQEQLSLRDPNLTPEEAARKAVELGWYGTFRRALQAVKMARGELAPERQVVRDGATYTRTL